jgi:hypothetical protein
MSWFSRPGDANASSFQQNPNPKSLFTFYLKSGERKNLLFLDDAQIAVWEAKIRVNGNWQRYTADTSNPDDPLVLAAASKKIYLSMVEYYTVLDLTPYTGKDGKERKYSKRALAVPKTMQEMIARRRNEVGGNLTGCMFTVVRDGEKSAACGNDWSFQKKVDLQKEIASGKLQADVVKPYDFMELLKPANSATVRSALSAMLGTVGTEPQTFSRDSLAADPFSSDEPTTTTSSEDVPF